MNLHVAFDCGDCIPVEADQTVQSVMDDHESTCRNCPDPRTPEEKRLDEKHQAEWEASVDAALAQAKEAS